MQPRARLRLTAMVVASALFMQNIDSTAVATALPSMARDFGIPLVQLSAAITAYLLALTVFIPVSGWVADRYGAKRVFLCAIALFSASSMLCALSSGLAPLVAGRVLQGLGGAMMVPVARLLLFKGARREEILDATTWLTMPALLGPLLGAPLGGFLTDVMSWRSVFWINVPLGAVGMALTWRFIEASPPSSSPPAPDLRGMGLTGVAIALFMVGVETIGRSLLPRGMPEICMLLAVGLFVLSVAHCRKVAHPAIDYALLRIPAFYVASVVGGLFRVGAGALPFIVPLTLQLSFGLSASHSGMLSLATALGSLCMRPLVRTGLSILRARTILLLGSLVFAAALLLCAVMDARWPAYAVFGVLLLAGLAQAFSFATLGALAFVDVPPEKLSAATSFHVTAQQLARAAGVAMAALGMEMSMHVAGRSQLALADFAAAFTLVSVVVLMSVPLYLSMDRDVGGGLVRKKGDAGRSSEHGR